MRRLICRVFGHDWSYGWDDVSGFRDCLACRLHEDFLPYSGYTGVSEPMRSYMAGEIDSAEYFKRIRERRFNRKVMA